jgi:ribosomal protein L16/L10AE
MTNQTTQTMAMSEKILAALNALSPDRQQQVFDFVEFLIQKQENSEVSHSTQEAAKISKKRILGQHKGMGWISDDFNAPLPDEFWFGNEGTGSSS